MDIFLKYESHLKFKDEKLEKAKVLSKFFNLDKTFLNFIDVHDTSVTKDCGTNDLDLYLIDSNTGRVKVTIKEYFDNLKILQPEFAVIPFEAVINY